MRARTRQTGFGLVEVLVALLIISIGLLGIAALQVTALRNTGSSMERSQAVIQTYSYLDVLRANYDEAIIGNLDVPVMACRPTNVDSDQIEERKWLTQLQEAMGPESCAKALCDKDKCTITIQWNDSRAEGGSTTQQLVTETVL